MFAAKHLDPVLGVDIHLIIVPGSPAPVPIPHPFIGMVLDPFDYLPIVGATVTINGMYCGVAGTGGKAVPPHFPIGGSFTKPPGNECEIFMGSSTVIADTQPLSYTALPALSCSDIGMKAPPRANKKEVQSLCLPTSVVLSVPGGGPVMVGGAPTISFMALAMKAGMMGLGKGLKKLRGLQKSSKKLKAISDKIQDFARKKMDDLKIPPSVRNKVHKAICTVTGHPVDVATGKMLTDGVDFELPGPIPLIWERTYLSTSDYEGPLGYGWHHNYDMSIAIDEQEKVLALHIGDGRVVGFPLPEPGEEHLESKEKLTAFKDADGYGIRNAEKLTHRFDHALDNGQRKLSAIVNQDGAKIAFAYNPIGHLQEIVDSVERKLTVQCDEETGRIQAILAPHPDSPEEQFQVVRYDYSEEGDLKDIIDAHNLRFDFEYDNHLLTKETDRNGLSFYFEYDDVSKGSEARCVRTWGDNGIYDHKLSYFPDEHKTIVTDSLGHQTTHYSNADGIVVKTIDAKGGISSKVYNEQNELQCEIDVLGRKTTYKYDNEGKLLKVIKPDSSEVKTRYLNGALAKIVNEIGAEWQWEVNEQGQPTVKIDPLKEKTTYEYNDQGLLEKTIDDQDNEVSITYDDQQLASELSLPNGQQTFFKYDRLGRCIEMSDSNGNVQKKTYDLLGRVTKIEDADGNETSVKYDGEGNVLSFQDKHKTVNFAYQGMGRLKYREEAGTRVRFYYDTEERLTSISNEHNSEYRFKLDALGDVTEEIGFDGTTKRYHRNAAGEVKRVSDAKIHYSNYEFDPLGRTTEIRYQDSAWKRFHYRADGFLMEATGQEGPHQPPTSVKYERDIAGRVIREYQQDHWVESSYDASDQRIRVTSSMGADIAIERDAMGLATKVSAGGTDPEEPAWQTDIKRDSFGLEIERNLPGGVRSVWKRDKLGRPIAHTITGGQQQTYLNRTYDWDVNNRLKSITDNRYGGAHFNYNESGSLSFTQYSDDSFDYRLPDAVGNLFRRKDHQDRKYGKAGQLLEAGGTRYEYDADGKLIRKTERNGKRWHYQWNPSGTLRRVTRPDNLAVTFRYDALGRRIRKTFKKQSTRWIWDGDVPLHEWIEPRYKKSLLQFLQESILPSSEPIPEANKEEPPKATSPPEIPENLITWVFEPESYSPVAKLTGEQQQSIVSDHLGTPIAMYDQTGNETWSAAYDTYGRLRKLNGDPSNCPFRYPGQYEDQETGLYYNRFRYYAPDEGIYISQDPIGLAGGMPNLYAYVNDPNTRMDPLGLTDCNIPGRVQSRINLANGRTRFTPLRDNGNPVAAGFDHVKSRHFGFNNSQSQFTVSESQLKSILQSDQVVKSPITRVIGQGSNRQFVREVNVGQNVGITRAADGANATSTIRVLTDSAGNLITTFPIP